MSIFQPVFKLRYSICYFWVPSAPSELGLSCTKFIFTLTPFEPLKGHLIAEPNWPLSETSMLFSLSIEKSFSFGNVQFQLFCRTLMNPTIDRQQTTTDTLRSNVAMPLYSKRRVDVIAQKESICVSAHLGEYSRSYNQLVPSTPPQFKPTSPPMFSSVNTVVVLMSGYLFISSILNQIVEIDLRTWLRIRWRILAGMLGIGLCIVLRNFYLKNSF